MASHDPQGVDHAHGGRPTADVPPTGFSRGRVARWVRNALFVGLLCSAIIHVSGIGLAGSIGIGGPTRQGDGSGPEIPGAVDFAVVPEIELATLTDGSEALDQVAIPSVSPLEPGDEAADDTLSSLGIGEVDAGVSDAAVELGIGGGAALNEGDGIGLGAGIGGGGTSFFGVEASGSRFAFILDMSASMNWDGKIDVLRSELARSIDSMTDQTDFVVVLFSDVASVLGDRRQWVTANETGKTWARRSMAAARPDGGTNPMPGFVIALGMRPRPDAVYFMTDGEFSDPDGVAKEINALNSHLKVPIHCICFVTAASEPVMRRIASASGGSYTFVPKR